MSGCRRGALTWCCQWRLLHQRGGKLGALSCASCERALVGIRYKGVLRIGRVCCESVARGGAGGVLASTSVLPAAPTPLSAPFSFSTLLCSRMVPGFVRWCASIRLCMHVLCLSSFFTARSLVHAALRAPTVLPCAHPMHELRACPSRTLPDQHSKVDPRFETGGGADAVPAPVL